MSDHREQLETLHTSAIDARNGYRDALEDASKHGLTGLFEEMIALHEGNANDLAVELTRRGSKADDDGSFMSVVHQTIMSIRGLFGALDQSVLPGLIDGEIRNVEKYDDALRELSGDSTVFQLLSAQRQRIVDSIAMMRAMKAD